MSREAQAARMEAIMRLRPSLPTFRRGDRVRVRLDERGALVSPLFTDAERDPELELDVVSDSYWVTVVADDGRSYKGYGATYFAIVGDCGFHAPAWKPLLDARERFGLDLPERYGWSVCARCDQPLPEHVPLTWLYSLSELIA